MLSPWRSADFKYLIRRGLCSECVSLVAALDLVCPRASSGYFLPSALTLTICEATSIKSSPVMETASLLSIGIALTLLNVWILRINRATQYRGGQARNMREEFEVYGLPSWLLPVVGVTKVGLAIALIASIWLPQLLQPVALGIACLMLAALLMHIKVSDGIKKCLPAALLMMAALFLGLGL